MWMLTSKLRRIGSEVRAPLHVPSNSSSLTSSKMWPNGPKSSPTSLRTASSKPQCAPGVAAKPSHCASSFALDPCRDPAAAHQRCAALTHDRYICAFGGRGGLGNTSFRRGHRKAAQETEKGEVRRVEKPFPNSRLSWQRLLFPGLAASRSRRWMAWACAGVSHLLHRNGWIRRTDRSIGYAIECSLASRSTWSSR